MRDISILIIFSFLPVWGLAQGGGPVTPTAGDLPNIIPPTPEVSAILKADFLSVNQSTGAANFSIPLHTITTGGFSVPVSLSYNSTGIKVDEIASMVGMGWVLNFGGVVSRTVMDVPDEIRDQGGNNLTAHNFSNPDYALLDYFDRENADKQSDIFTFSFGGYNGKFILDQNLSPRPLSNYNLKISIINGAFLEGFIIVSDDGTEYYFQHAETSMSRNLVGTNCKPWNAATFDEVKTSWYLTKIVLPSRQREINFTYISGATTFKTGLNQSLTLNTAAELYQCGGTSSGPTGPACSVGETRFSSCSGEQVVQTQFISKIETTGGDKIEFFYDTVGRQDLTGGLRLASFKVTNFHGKIIKHGIFNGSYQTAINATPDAESKRLFLESLYIRNGSNSIADQQVFTFGYLNYSNLPKRLSFAQDIYGFYNGKTSNTCLIPKLGPDDLNYSLFNNGTGYGSVIFGDRAIDATYSSNGLLTTINYPTGGYDNIIYTPNYRSKVVNGVEVEQLCGGISVKKIVSYSKLNEVALEKEFVYRYYSDNKLSTFLITENVKFSEIRIVKSDGYSCVNAETGGAEIIYCSGPACTKATSASSSYYPTTTYGSQHVYHRSVLEYTKSGNDNNGFVEHKYLYYMDGGLVPQTIMGDEILNTAYNIIPDILIGENEIHIYKRSSTGYHLLKSTIREFENINQSFWHNYFVRKNYKSVCSNRPGIPATAELQAYDVVEGRIYFNTPLLKKLTEKTYDENGVILEDVVNMEYDNPLYTYPTRITKTGSDGRPVKTEKKYVPDFPAMTAMNSRNIISPVIEEKYFRDNVLLTTKTQTYVDWFSNTNLLVPQNIELKNGTSAQTQKIIFHDYDIFGNVLDVSKEDDVHSNYIWDYRNDYPVAKIQNAIAGSVAYTSFEADGSGNWIITSSARIQDGITGNQCYQLSNGNIRKTNLNASAEYILTYWTRNSIPFTIGSTSGNAIQTFDGWTLFQHNITGITEITLSGLGLIDEVRLYPKGAQMTTYTYEPLIGITSVCDIANKLIYYEYDDFSRLRLIRDQDKNILKKFDYQYQAPTHNNATWANTGNTRCKPCAANSAYSTNVQQNEEKDTNPNSATYNQLRWVDAGTSSTCVISADWQFTTTAIRCKQAGGENTGEQEREQKDLNPCSQTYNTLRWVVTGVNTSACPMSYVYARITLTNPGGGVSDVVVAFFEDAACTMPVSVTNLVVNWQEEEYNDLQGTSTYNSYSTTCNGTETVLAYGVALYGPGPGQAVLYRYYSLLSGTGYSPTN